MTDRASRYLVQICEHLNQISDHARHGAPADSHAPLQVQCVEWTDEHGRIEFPAAWCTLDATDSMLTVTVAADEADELQRMRDLFTTRFEAIGRRDNLTLTW